jgi:hypothetical protein
MVAQRRTYQKRTRLNSNNSTGYLGVYHHHDRFRAMGSVGGHLQHIGVFDTAEGAAAAYNEWADARGLPNTHLNPKEHTSIALEVAATVMLRRLRASVLPNLKALLSDPATDPMVRVRACELIIRLHADAMSALDVMG